MYIYYVSFSSRSLNTSISRCTCCDTRTSSVFTLTHPTPGHENSPQCPSQNYSQTIQMRLINGAYDIWNGNTQLVAELKRQIAAGISEYCRCGFNVNYLTGRWNYSCMWYLARDWFYCQSVIWTSEFTGGPAGFVMRRSAGPVHFGDIHKV